jgi:hypothetical protein
MSMRRFSRESPSKDAYRPRLPIKFIEPASNAPEQREPDINAKEKGENAVKDITNPCGKKSIF